MKEGGSEVTEPSTQECYNNIMVLLTNASWTSNVPYLVCQALKHHRYDDCFTSQTLLKASSSSRHAPFTSERTSCLNSAGIYLHMSVNKDLMYTLSLIAKESFEEITLIFSLCLE